MKDIITSREDVFLAKIAGRDVDIGTLTPPVATSVTEKLLLETADRIDRIEDSLPSGTIQITENGTHDVAQYASAEVNVPNPSTGTLSITSNDTYDVTQYASAEVNVPNPSTGTLQITENNTYDVTQYASAEVNVPSGPQQMFGEITVVNNTGNSYFSFSSVEADPDAGLVNDSESIPDGESKTVNVLLRKYLGPTVYALPRNGVYLASIGGPTVTGTLVATKTSGANHLGEPIVESVGAGTWIIRTPAAQHYPSPSESGNPRNMTLEITLTT